MCLWNKTLNLKNEIQSIGFKYRLLSGLNAVKHFKILLLWMMMSNCDVKLQALIHVCYTVCSIPPHSTWQIGGHYCCWDNFSSSFYIFGIFFSKQKWKFNAKKNWKNHFVGMYWLPFFWIQYSVSYQRPITQYATHRSYICLILIYFGFIVPLSREIFIFHQVI